MLTINNEQGISAIPSRLQQKVSRELAADETIIWITRPLPHFFTKESVLAFVFGIFWTSTTFFVSRTNMEDPETPDLVFFMGFYLVGLACILCPLWVCLDSIRTVYAITNKRAITFEGGVTATTVRSYPPDKLTDVYRRDRSDGSGDVVIARHAWWNSGGDKHNMELGFFRIRNPKHVEELLHLLANSSPTSSQQV